MKIGNLPLERIVKPDGHIHSSWRQFFSQMVNQLQYHVSDEGYYLPRRNEESKEELDKTLKKLESQEKSKGGLLYATFDNKSKINNDGSYKNLSTYESLPTADIEKIKPEELSGQLLHDSDKDQMQFASEGEVKTALEYHELKTAEINAIPAAKRRGKIFLDTDTGDLKIDKNGTLVVLSTTT